MRADSMVNENNRPQPIENRRVGREEIVFGHPSEEEFARLLDFYGIEWRYEPVTFPLVWDKKGNVLEAFSPDFYLVEQDLFVELTTLRPRLMRIKREKIRLMNELYPEVRVKLWRRRDFEWLLARYGEEGRHDELVGQSALNQQDNDDRA